MHPIRWLAASAHRVSLVSLASLAALVGVAIMCARYVRFDSASPSADLLIVTGLMLGILGIAFLQAVWLGELLLGADWRQRYLLGEMPALQVSDEFDMNAVKAIRSGRSERLQLAALVALAVFGDVFVVNRATGNFFDDYTRVGYHRTALRGADAGERAQLLLELADRSTDEVAEWVDAVMVPRLESADPVEQQDALRALWWVARRMSRSVDLLNAARARPDRWEYELSRRLREQIAPRVRALALQTTSDGVRELAFRFLGDARDPEATSMLGRALLDPEQSIGAREAAALALGRLSHEGVFAHLLALLRTSDAPPRVQEAALWAVGEGAVAGLPADAGEYEKLTGRPYAPPMELDEASVWMIHELPRLEPSPRCVALNALQRTQDARAFDVIAPMFESPDATFSCPTIELTEPYGPPVVLSRGEPYRLTLLRVVASVAAGNPAVAQWLSLQKQVSSKYAEDIQRELESLAAKANDEF